MIGVNALTKSECSLSARVRNTGMEVLGLVKPIEALGFVQNSFEVLSSENMDPLEESPKDRDLEPDQTLEASRKGGTMRQTDLKLGSMVTSEKFQEVTDRLARLKALTTSNEGEGDVVMGGGRGQKSWAEVAAPSTRSSIPLRYVPPTRNEGGQWGLSCGKPNQSKTKTEREGERQKSSEKTQSYLARAPSVAKGAELSSVAKSLQKIVCSAPKQRHHQAVNTEDHPSCLNAIKYLQNRYNMLLLIDLTEMLLPPVPIPVFIINHFTSSLENINTLHNTFRLVTVRVHIIIEILNRVP
ncbi:hypothetical protein TEA_024324 [Camellia sinensis var. sinensis]|uniref:Uncharacterized protein n=1 Tax=Camellia sinensis var. sinensis TaxID=542762 RepID=A0A4S4F2M8_CAMSN|nr:hypothetical protein TEA_024324 [Camellia sinensis var. sinensis]